MMERVQQPAPAVLPLGAKPYGLGFEKGAAFPTAVATRSPPTLSLRRRAP